MKPLVFACGALAWNVACDVRSNESAPIPARLQIAEPCSPGSRSVPERAQAIRKILGAASHPLLEPLRQRASETPLCFHAGPSVLAGNEVRLDAKLDDLHAAARLAHLLHHITAPVWQEEDPRSCTDRVSTALEQEATAWAFEFELGRQLGVHEASPYEFEAEYWRRPLAERQRYLTELFAKGADPVRGVPPLAESYRNRCAKPEPALNPLGTLETR